MSSKTIYDYITTDHITTDAIFNTLNTLQDSTYHDKPTETKEKVNSLFAVALNNANVLFPKLNVPMSSNDPADYISKWLKKYYDADQNLPSSKQANQKSAANDPALSILVKEHEHYTDEQNNTALFHHNLFMSAENVQGNLLEEYIASVVEPLGWIWAKGETMRACDFIKHNLVDSLIQIKNKSNTENSSSMSIRSGTQIRKWNRLKTSKIQGIPTPSFNWEELNTLLKVPEDQLMTEEKYNIFLANTVRQNPNIITV